MSQGWCVMARYGRDGQAKNKAALKHKHEIALIE